MAQMGITVITLVTVINAALSKTPIPAFAPVGIFSSLPPAICLFSPSLPHGFKVGIATGGGGLHMT